VVECVRDRERDGAPVLFLGGELTASGGSDLVGAGAPLVRRHPPPRRHEPRLLEPMEGRVERPFFDAQALGGAFDVRGDRIAVHRPAAREDLQDQQRQRTLQRITSCHT